MSPNPSENTKYRDLFFFVVGAVLFALPFYDNLRYLDAYLASRFGITESPAIVTRLIDFWRATIGWPSLGHSQWTCVTLGLCCMLFALWRVERRYLQGFYLAHNQTAGCAWPK
jgi:hypothetical protein